MPLLCDYCSLGKEWGIITPSPRATMRGEEDVACGIRSTSSTVCTPSGTHAYVKKWFKDSTSTTWIVLTVGCIASQLELGLSLSASKGEACRCLSERPSFSFLAFISVRENEGRRALGRLAEDETPWDDLGQTVCPRASVAKVTRNATALERFGNSLVWIFLLHKAREECYDPLLCSFLDFLLAPQKALGQEQDDIFQNETVKQGKARQDMARPDLLLSLLLLWQGWLIGWNGAKIPQEPGQKEKVVVFIPQKQQKIASDFILGSLRMHSRTTVLNLWVATRPIWGLNSPFTAVAEDRQQTQILTSWLTTVAQSQ